MDDITIQFAKNAKKIRLKQGLSQGDVARRLNLHRSYISGIERGIRNPSLKVVQKIAKALGVNANALLDNN